MAENGTATLWTATVLPRLRQLIAERGYALTNVCHYLGKHPNTLQRINDPHWNPQLDTLVAIEGFVIEAEKNEDLKLCGPDWSLRCARHDTGNEWWIKRKRDTPIGPFSQPQHALRAAENTS
jgi:hypothetical protein